jgi:hypothetical protein
MIFGLRVLLYSKNAEADRAFFRDILGFRAIDAGGGWLIFRTPPTEMAVHPIDGESTQAHAGHRMSEAVLYLMCDDLQATIKSLAAKKVKCTRWSGELCGALRPTPYWFESKENWIVPPARTRTLLAYRSASVLNT